MGEQLGALPRRQTPLQRTAEDGGVATALLEERDALPEAEVGNVRGVDLARPVVPEDPSRLIGGPTCFACTERGWWCRGLPAAPGDRSRRKQERDGGSQGPKRCTRPRGARARNVRGPSSGDDSGVILRLWHGWTTVP